jgi:hypothetical protein
VIAALLSSYPLAAGADPSSGDAGATQSPPVAPAPAAASPPPATPTSPATPAPAPAAPAAAAVVAPAPAARAPAAVVPPALPIRLDKPFVLRFELHITYKGYLFDEWTSTVQASSLGVTLGWNVREHVAFEGMIGVVPPTTRWVDDRSSGGIKRADVDPGFASMGAVRYAAFTTPTGRKALTIAGGYYAVLSDAYGPVLFAHTDMAFELRSRSYTFLVGYGVNVVMNRSDRLPSLCNGPFACDVGFDVGDVLWHFRIGWGPTHGAPTASAPAVSPDGI